jgi:iron complex outermembrane recepter protein
MLRKFRHGWLLLLGSVVLCCCNDAVAQQATSDSLREIVITATKRETTVQTTPLSVTAVSGVDIQARGVVDFDTLAQSIPGIGIKTAGPGQTEFEMRGMTSVGGNSPTVGFYLDDAPLTAPATSSNGKVVIDPSLYDLNRVEVLRGPQGTLYGAGSMGGTIKIVTNAPNPHAFDASAQTAFSDTDGGGFNHGENAMVNLPLSNTLAVRIVASESHDSGWIDRIVIANGTFPLETNNLTTRGNILAAPVAADYKNVNDADLTGARIALLWKPTDQLTVTPSFLYQRIQQGGESEIDSDPGTNAHYQPFNSVAPFEDRINLGSISVAYQFDYFDLTSITSRWSRDETLQQDGNEELQWAFSTPTAILPYYTSQGGIGTTDPTPLEMDDTQQTSEELRLTSPGDSNFKWIAGYFYSDFYSNTYAYLNVPGAVPVFGTSDIFHYHQPTKIIQNSFFGELSYKFAPQWTATAGIRRYSYNESLYTSVSGVFSETGTDAVATSSSSAHDAGVNPKFDLSYQVDENLLLYATIAKGFRPGGGNEPIPTTGSSGAACEVDLQAAYKTSKYVQAPEAFQPDSLWSYEIGEKVAFLGDRLTIDSAVYFESWSQTQQLVPLACGFSYTANAGDAHIYGGETEIKEVLMPGLVLSGNAGYTHAYFAVGSSAAGIATGTAVTDIPDWTSGVSLAYRRPIPGDLALTSLVENNYVGSRTDVTYATNQLPSYDLTNLRIGIEGSQWKAALFAKNVFNERAFLSNALQLNVNVPMYNRIAVSQPLTVGIDLSYHFGP